MKPSTISELPTSKAKATEYTVVVKKAVLSFEFRFRDGRLNSFFTDRKGTSLFFTPDLFDQPINGR